MKKAIAAAGDGQLLVPSFQGSRVDGMDRKAYIADHVTTAHLVMETGAGLMEMNTSCPNEGHNRLLCHDPHLVGEITEAVKNEIGDRPLIVKLAYIPNDTDLETMVRETVGHGTVQGFSTINTISARLVDANGNQALPGVGRKTANVIRGNIFHEPSVVVDTHVKRISKKLGLTKEDDPEKVEYELMKVLPKDHWILYNIQIITLGRTICKAPTPKCGECFLTEWCKDYQNRQKKESRKKK